MALIYHSRFRFVFVNPLIRPFSDLFTKKGRLMWGLVKRLKVIFPFLFHLGVLVSFGMQICKLNSILGEIHRNYPTIVNKWCSEENLTY